MYDFPNKVITILLVFFMLVIAPSVWMYEREEMISDRLVLNEMSRFLDTVTDKGTITEQDINDLYVGLNASGGTYDVKVKRYIYAPTPTANSPRAIYINVPYYDKNTNKPSVMTQGDLVKVTVDEVGISPAKRLLWNLLHLDTQSTKMSLSATVQ